MSFSSILLYGFEAVAACAAVGVLFARNVFYGALLLICCLLAIAGLFVFLHADFVAITQILVYAGGVLVLIIFGIMLSSRISGKPLIVQHNYVFSGAILGVALTMLLFLARYRSPVTVTSVQSQQDNDNIASVGVNIMSEYLVPFEIAGVLLLVALIGAVVVASSSKSKSI